jgi:hypothetical protein
VWETSPMGPFTQWPLGSGFEYFYGFVGAETNQWYPALYEGVTPIEPPKTPEEGYHLTEDLTDRAITWVGQQKSLMPDKPFLTASTGTRVRLASNRPLMRVQVSRSAAGGAYGQLPGHRRLAGGRERCRLLVTHVLPHDLTVPTKRVGEPVDRIPRQPVHPAHAGRLQGRHHDVGNGPGGGHAAAPLVPASMRSAVAVPSPYTRWALRSFVNVTRSYLQIGW